LKKQQPVKPKTERTKAAASADFEDDFEEF
jgi:hypothetical protein